MSNPVRTLGAIIYPDFELLDLYGPLEMFGSLKPELEIVTIADKPGPVASTQGPETVAQFSYADAPPCELILLPGGIGTLAQLENRALADFLRARAAQCERMMSVCSGSAILAKIGLLDGKRATSNKMYFNLASSQSDQVHWQEKARWVEDGIFVTSSGVSAGTDMALAVIANLYGQERAEQIAVYTEYQWHTEADRDPFAKYLNQADANG